MREGIRENQPEHREAQRWESEAAALSTLLLGVPPEQEPETDTAMKEWLNSALQREADSLADEWDLVPDDDLRQRIAEAEDDTERAALQAEYLRATCAKFQKRHQYENRDERRSTKWDSWPTMMRQAGEFNCAGATLLGDAVLRRAGIESIIGHLPSHVVNVARLANGDYWYADLASGPSQTRRIDAREQTVEGKRMLVFNDPAIDYNMIVPQANTEIGALAMGNLAHLQGVVIHGSDAGREEDRQAAEALVAAHPEMFASHDFSELGERLFGASPTNGSSAMQEQERRVSRLRADSNLGASFVKTLTRDQVTNMVKEMLVRADDIGPYLRGEVSDLPADTSPELADFLGTYVREFHGRHGDDLNLQKVTADRMLARFKG